MLMFIDQIKKNIKGLWGFPSNSFSYIKMFFVHKNNAPIVYIANKFIILNDIRD